jgi:hypothetical protein
METVELEHFVNAKPGSGFGFIEYNTEEKANDDIES